MQTDTIDNATCAMELTPIQIAALRQADRVCFHHSPDKGSYIMAVKENRVATKANPFAGEVEIRINCGTKFTDYSKDHGQSWPLDSNFRAFEWVSSAQYSPEWTTIAALLANNDRLTLHWKRDAQSTDGSRGIGYHGDSLHLIVNRNGRIKELTFLIDVSFCPDNTARMIRSA